MIIAAALHSAPPRRWVGGEAMTLALLEKAQASGHRVTIVCAAWGQPGAFKGIPIIAGSDRPAIRTLFNQADIVVTHPEIVTAHKYPRIGIVHNLNDKTIGKCKQRQWKALVANSQWTWDNLVDQGIQPSHLIYPPVTKPQVAVQRNAVFVSNLSEDKGAGVVRQAALDLDYPFIGAIGGYNPQDLGMNIEYVEHGPLDFSNARVMLAPSKSETYGMAIAEATLLGIPVVASDIPAHREVLGEAGIYVPLDAAQEQWNDAIALAWQRKPCFDRAKALAERTQDSFDSWLSLLDHLDY